MKIQLHLSTPSYGIRNWRSVSNPLQSSALSFPVGGVNRTPSSFYNKAKVSLSILNKDTRENTYHEAQLRRKPVIWPNASIQQVFNTSLFCYLCENKQLTHRFLPLKKIVPNASTITKIVKGDFSFLITW